MALEIRKTLPGDVAAGEAVLEDGRAALAELDIPQWRGSYPSRIDIERDIAAGSSYVALDERGSILGIMTLSLDGEEAYDRIEGSWLTDSDSSSPLYAVIHRCAVCADAARRGVMSRMFSEAERIARGAGKRSIRVDTHERNVRMRGLMSKLGYSRCGVITLSDPEETDPARVAFEKLID